MKTAIAILVILILIPLVILISAFCVKVLINYIFAKAFLTYVFGTPQIGMLKAWTILLLTSLLWYKPNTSSKK